MDKKCLVPLETRGEWFVYNADANRLFRVAKEVYDNVVSWLNGCSDLDARLRTIVEMGTAFPVDSPRPVVKKVSIHIANLCNMRCRYCYADGGNYGQTEEIMNSEVLDAVVDFVNETESIDTVQFFGGEPLLNSRAILQTVKAVKRDSVTFGLVTNLTKLDQLVPVEVRI